MAPCAKPEKPPTNSTIVSTQTVTALPEFQIKKGFRIELAANDTLVESPAAMAFDESGRLYVAEMREDQVANGETSHRGRIRLLEDKDGDGTFDTNTIYADNLPSPSAVACYGGGIFVAVGPDIIYLKSNSGGGTADVRRVVFSGFGSTPNTGRNTNDSNALNASAFLNNFNWGLDNRIHGLTAGIGGIVTNASEPSADLISLVGSDFSFDPRMLTISPEAGSARSGLSFDNSGRKFASDPARPLRLVMYEPRYLARNPFFPKPPLMTDLVSPSTPISKFVWAAASNPGTASRSGNRLIAGWLTNACGIAIYRGSLFSSNYTANAFIADPEARIIHREVLRDAGLAIAATRAPDEPGTEFLIARDELFKPSQIINGPDGALYVADKRGSEGAGRIYRIVPEGFKQPKPPQLAAARTYDLVTTLAHANGWHRDTAARLLYERRDPAAIPLLTNMLNNSRMALARLHALHALDGLGALNETVVSRGLRDPDERVREHAILLVEKLLSNGPISQALWNQLRALAMDPSLRVRYQLAFTLGEFRHPAKSQALAEIAFRDPANPWLCGAVLSSLADGGTEVLTNLAANARFRADPAGLQFLQQLATMIGVQGQTEQEINPLLEYLQSANLEPLQLFKILTGLGEGLRRSRSSLALVDKQGHLIAFYPQAMQTALDPNAAESLRLEAFRVLNVSPYTLDSTADLFLLMLGSGESQALQAAAIEFLGRFTNRQIAASLIARWSSLSPALHGVALSVLLERNDRVPLVLAAVQEGKISARDFSSVQMDFLRTHRDLGTRQQAMHLFGVPVVKKPLLVQRFTPALALKGAPKHGQEIFLARCSSCHTLAAQGHRVGPDLAEWKRLGKEKMLLSILEPNNEVRKQYETSTILTRDGENLVGLVTDENLATIALRRPNREEIVLPRTNIETIETHPWSLMPEGLQEGLTVQALADLLDYIMVTPR